MRVDTIKKAWALLDPKERLQGWLVLLVSIIAALTAVGMIASVAPFLSVLANPGLIQDTPILVWAFDVGGFESTREFLVALGLFCLAFILFGSAMQVFRAWIVKEFTMMRAHTLSMRLLREYQSRRYEFFLGRNSSELATRVLSETQNFVSMFLYPLAELVSASVLVIFVISLLFWLAPLVTLIALSLFGAAYLTTFLLSKKKVVELGDVRAAANASRYRTVQEALQGIKDIKLSGRELSYLDRYEAPSFQMSRSIVLVGLISELPQHVMQALAFAGLIVLSLLLLPEASGGSSEALAAVLPTLGVFAFAGQRLIPELSKIYRGVAQMQYGDWVVETLHSEMFDAASPSETSLDRVAPLGFKSTLQLDCVSFEYRDADRTAISDISIAIQTGERIGVVGGSGAGKSTLANVILGLLSPTAGKMVVDGISIADHNRRAWQASVGYVPQDFFLADGSVAENIAFGLPKQEIEMARVKEAARTAQIDTFVCEELAHGYETVIGERGARLSGGQKQRLGIARALYRRADLLVFDEATSALDNLTEKEVMAAIDDLPTDKTVFIIAHRLTTIRNCNRILVMDKGRIVASGTWEGLLSTSGHFKKMAAGVS